MFFTFFKLYKWYQTAQRTTYSKEPKIAGVSIYSSKEICSQKIVESFKNAQRIALEGEKELLSVTYDLATGKIALKM